MATAKKAPKKATTKRSPAKSKSPAKPASKKANTKATAKSAATKKTATAKKPATKKTTVSKPATKKATPKKSATSAKKSSPKETTTKKASAKKATAKATTKKPSAAKKPVATPATPKPTATKKPPAPKSPFDKAFLQKQTRLLQKEREKYIKSSENLEHEAQQLLDTREQGDVQFDEESAQGDSWAIEREQDLILSAEARATVEKIDEALDRIKAGTYGICQRTGKPIQKARLQAIPWATERVEPRATGLLLR